MYTSEFRISFHNNGNVIDKKFNIENLQARDFYEFTAAVQINIDSLIAELNLSGYDSIIAFECISVYRNGELIDLYNDYCVKDSIVQNKLRSIVKTENHTTDDMIQYITDILFNNSFLVLYDFYKN